MSAAPSSRDAHLFGPGPKKILALDGGGVRGALSVAFLERIEEILDERAGTKVRLCDYFDLIGGTSTGSIIASFLAFGKRASDIKQLYLDLANVVFKRSFWRVQGLRAKFDAKALSAELAKVIGTRTLDSADLLTGLVIVAKRMDTESTWVISNSPKAPYWNEPADHSYIGNHQFVLANVVRASTAAPHYFDPEPLPIVAGGDQGLFVDGGLTPHNNPSLACLMVARAKAFGLTWATGPQNLSIFSIGTGGARRKTTLAHLKHVPPLGLAINALAGMIDENQRQSLALMQAMGECPQPWVINSEAGTLAGELLPGHPLFRFLRYDAQLDQDWLSHELDMTVPAEDLLRTAHFDDPSVVALVYEIGKKAAQRQVLPEHLPL